MRQHLYHNCNELLTACSQDISFIGTVDQKCLVIREINCMYMYNTIDTCV